MCLVPQIKLKNYHFEVHCRTTICLTQSYFPSISWATDYHYKKIQMWKFDFIPEVLIPNSLHFCARETVKQRCGDGSKVWEKQNTQTNQKQLQQWCGLIKMHQQTCERKKQIKVHKQNMCNNAVDGSKVHKLKKHMNKLKTAATMGVDGSNVCTNKQATRTSNKIDYWKDRDWNLQQ